MTTDMYAIEEHGTIVSDVFSTCIQVQVTPKQPAEVDCRVCEMYESCSNADVILHCKSGDQFKLSERIQLYRVVE